MNTESLHLMASPTTDIAIAERVLRWDMGPFEVDERGVARGRYNAEVPLYSSADAIAVTYLLPKLRERCTVVIQIFPTTTPVDVYPKDEHFTVELGFKQQNVMARAGSLALAMCRAALMLADLMEGRHG